LIVFQLQPSKQLAENPTAAGWYNITPQITGPCSEPSKRHMPLAFIYSSRTPLHGLLDLCPHDPRRSDSAL